MTPISDDPRYPLAFDAPALSAGALEYLRDPTIRRMVDFFRAKGLAALKQEDRREDWYQDWIAYQARHGLYASLLSPERYSSPGHRLDLGRLTRFMEVFAYFSPAHAYSLQVTFLGLFPILMSANEPLKREAIARLEDGGLFAFAVSERAHGSDLLANEFTVRPADPAGWVADGAKDYIGNANTASMISVLARKGVAGSAALTRRSPLVFFALRPREAPAFRNLRKIRTLGIRSAYVGAFEVRGHSLPEGDVISEGRAAWDAVFGTVNLGKFFLGLGAVGICEHAFAEAFDHLRRRVLYGRPVTEMPHIRAAVVTAFARLTAMKFYAYRALDYVQAAGADDRRYLLFNAVQKAKVSTEGIKVLGLLTDCLGARGVESETYFEMALRDAQLVPRLEGSTHINYGLTAQFLDAYLAGPGPGGPAQAPRGNGSGENPYWMEGRDRTARTVRFAPPLAAYEPLRAVANVRSFRKQVKAVRRFAGDGASALNPIANADLAIALGKCLSTIAFGQLVAECCAAVRAAPATVALLFQGLVEDLSAESLTLAALFRPGSASRALLRGVVRVPRTGAGDRESIFDFIATRYGA